MSPSPFIVEWVERFARERGGRLRALDVAMGTGRHALMMARAGLVTFGVDAKLSAVQVAGGNPPPGGVRLHPLGAGVTQHPPPRRGVDGVGVAPRPQRGPFPP